MSHNKAVKTSPLPAFQVKSIKSGAEPSDTTRVSYTACEIVGEELEGKKKHCGHWEQHGLRIW